MPVQSKPSHGVASQTSAALPDFPSIAPDLAEVPGAVETNAAYQQWWTQLKYRLLTTQDGNQKTQLKLSASFNTSTGGLQAQINEEKIVRADADGALASSITSLSATVTNNYTTLNAAITSEASTRASQTSALATRTTALEASIDTPTTGLLARVAVIESAYVDASGAYAQAITAINAQLTGPSGTIYSAVQTEASARATADGHLSANYSITVTAGSVVTGMQLNSSSGGGTTSSTIDFQGANFRIWDGTTAYPIFYTSTGLVTLANTLTVNTSGKVFTGTGTYANANTPFYVDSTRFALGAKLTFDSGTGILAVDGSGTFSGSVTATSGTIGGWTLGATSLTAGTGATTVGLDSGGTNPAFYAGSATPGSAPFRVTNAGVLTATGATISGSITSTSGTIGGFDIGADYIRDSINSFGLASTVTGGDDVRFWAGDTFANRATAHFRLYESGAIFSTSGTIGGFAIGANTLTSGSGNTSVRIDSSTSTPVIQLGDVSGYHVEFRGAAAINPELTLWNGSSALCRISPNTGFASGELRLFDSSVISTITMTGNDGAIDTSGTVNAFGGFQCRPGSGAAGVSNWFNVSYPAGTLRPALWIDVTNFGELVFAGAYTATPGVPTGYVTMLDSSGTARRFMVGT